MSSETHIGKFEILARGEDDINNYLKNHPEIKDWNDEPYCPHLVKCSDGTYSCIWSIHGPACTICYELYPRNYK